MILFDRQTYFDAVRASLFKGSMTQQQVDGQEFKLAAYEAKPFSADLRHLAYAFATSYHETAKKMWPIEEYGKGKDRPYGKQDPETKQTYYGRGDVQLTWRENYARATRKMDLTGGTDDLEWHAERALDPTLSAEIMYSGMSEGWFTGKKLSDFLMRPGTIRSAPASSSTMTSRPWVRRWPAITTNSWPRSMPRNDLSRWWSRLLPVKPSISPLRQQRG